jgi:hypothetical protein
VTTQDPGQPPGQPTEEELQAAYEAELKRIHVDDVLLQTVVSLLNLGGRRAGLSSPNPPAEDERDLGQVRSAIEGVRALLPLVEPRLGPDAAQLRQALSQLQLAYARGAGAGEPGGAPGGGDESGGAPAEPQPAGDPEGPGPAQSSGRLWVPGQ